MVKKILLYHERRLSTNQARQQRCKRNFLGGKAFECSGAATTHKFFSIMGNINLCTEFEVLDAKVLIIFLSTVDFSFPNS